MSLRSPAIVLLLVWALAIASPSAAAEQQFDLQAPLTLEDPPVMVSSGTVSVRVINKAPTGRYRIDWELRRTAIPPLELPTAGIEEEPDTTCSHLRATTDTLLKCDDEAKVPDLVERIKDALEKSCDSTVENSASQAIARTRSSPIVVEMGSDAQLYVTVVRLADDGSETKRWEVVYKTEPSGEWFASYGFTFIPSDNDVYFSKSAGPDSFQVTKEADNQEFDFAPAVFFSWMPGRLSTPALSPSLTAGLGFDLDNPVVFLGLSLSYHYNISLVGGGVMHQVTRLSGKYEPNDTITENLSEGQLSEDTYAFGWFFGVSFRFGGAPKTHEGVVKALSPAAGDEDKPSAENDGEQKPAEPKENGEGKKPADSK